ncbi:MAG: autotransporter protein, partial [Betaproteobacteria bacterium]|nr:autotransporter protein [Betaproteobacteria bacterium]
MVRPLALACALAWAPGAWACNAGDSATLIACVANSAGDGTINITANITLAANFNSVLGSTVVINGNGHTLDGAGTYRGFFIGAGSTTINDLTMSGLKAQGGAGGVELAGGGGGMGAGGAVFVQTGAALTINNVSLLSNSAAGGNGGGSNSFT